MLCHMLQVTSVPVSAETAKTLIMLNQVDTLSVSRYADMFCLNIFSVPNLWYINAVCRGQGWLMKHLHTTESDLEEI